MEPRSWKRLEEVFFGALERPSQEREAFVRAACGDDSAFRDEVLAVLKAHEEAGGTAEPDRLLQSFEEPARVGSLTGSRLGVYRVDELIGHGGMGEVYRATRDDEEYRQQVAIKVVRAGRSTPESVRRFRVERQILASLEHPNITTLLDGGVTPGGDPFLVMQYVDGVPITRFAEQKRLPIEERLRLFIAVANAIQFAHGNLIVHRDLKPSNILVTADAQPRIMDFGIAKLLQADASSPATVDQLLTPEHAAPEQFLGQPVTTATDVYALGVLLYELLATVRPFGGLGGVELARAVCETDPPPPSAVAPTAVARLVRGDLDQIVLMALRKEPERRYASAGQFAEDVSRYLAGRPVIARPDVLAYRVRKFVARNKAAVAAATLVVATLVGAVIVTASEAQRRAAALRVANAERASATRISDFMIGVFTSNDPSEARGRTVTARELLDRAAISVQGDLAEDPSVRTDLELAMGRAYLSLGLGARAAPMIDEAVAFRRTQRPTDALKLADALEWKARSAAGQGRPAEGVALAREALALREQALGPNDVAVGRSLILLAGFLVHTDMMDTTGQGQASVRRALEIFRSADPPAYRDIANALRATGWADLDRNQPARSLEDFQSAIAEARKAVSEDDPLLFNLYEGLAIAYQANGQSDSAIAIQRRLLASRERVFGPDHPDVGFSLFNLARTLMRARRYDEGLRYFQQALDLRERVLGRDHYLVGFTLNSYAVATAQSGDLAAAAVRFERAAHVLAGALGPTHLTVQDAWEGLAIVRTMQGERRAAFDALDAAVLAGYRRPERLEQPPFKQLAGDPRYQDLQARMRRPAS